jgi:hypothetical protein
MKTKILILALLAAVLFISCEKEENTTLLSEVTNLPVLNDTLVAIQNSELVMFKLTEYNFRSRSYYEKNHDSFHDGTGNTYSTFWDINCADKYIYTYKDSSTTQISKLEIFHGRLRIYIPAKYADSMCSYEIVELTEKIIALTIGDGCAIYYFNIIKN